MRLFLLFIYLVVGPFSFSQTIHTKNQGLARTVNLGNALEAPSEGYWGLVLEELYFQEIKSAGFDAVRLPVSWTHHASQEQPYRINEQFFERVDWALEQAKQNDLNIILNVHHYDALNENPEEEKVRFLAMWKQVSERYQSASDHVYFEILNEPHARFNDDAELWNTLLIETLGVIRKSNQNRSVIIGPVGYNSIDRLSELRLPDDSNLIATVHFYDPFAFTHQGADWVEPLMETGQVWTGEQIGFIGQDRSWDTRYRWLKDDGRDALELTYERGWAGFYLYQVTESYDELVFEAKGEAQIFAGCLEPDQAIDLSADWQTYRVDLRNCANTHDIVIQNATDQRQNPFMIAKLELRKADEVLSFFQTEKDAIRHQLDKAEAWAQEQNVPLFLGEFGAYSAADMPSRIRWIRFVREAFEARGFSWAYWEFGAGFGLYDPANNTWRSDLLDALLVD